MFEHVHPSIAKRVHLNFKGLISCDDTIKHPRPAKQSNVAEVLLNFKSLIVSQEFW